MILILILDHNTNINTDIEALDEIMRAERKQKRKKKRIVKEKKDRKKKSKYTIIIHIFMLICPNLCIF
jgi:hypothetical protein